MPIRRRRSESPTRAETLLSLLLLGLLAAVTAPGQTASGSADRGALETQALGLTSSLAVLRNAVDAFAADQGTTRERLAPPHRTALTDGHETLTPYLRRGRLPLNPVNGRRTLRVVDAMPAAPTGEAGWLLCARDGEVRADVGGTTPDGVPYFDL